MNSFACMTTSWDDGHPLDHRLADLLEANRLGGTFYIPQISQKPTMFNDDIRRLAARFEIGAHTMRHTFLCDVDEPTARREIVDSKAWIQDVTGRPCTMFCPPAGEFRQRDLRLIRDAGYLAIRSTELMSVAPPARAAGVAILPTTVHVYPHGAGDYFKNAMRRRKPMNFLRYLVSERLARWEPLAESMLARVAAHGGVFHLWGHSWEIEETGQWDALARVLKVMSGFLDRLPCLTNSEVCKTLLPQPELNTQPGKSFPPHMEVTTVGRASARSASLKTMGDGGLKPALLEHPQVQVERAASLNAQPRIDRERATNFAPVNKTQPATTLQPAGDLLPASK